MHTLHKGARMRPERYTDVYDARLDLEVTTLIRKTKSSIPAKGNAGLSGRREKKSKNAVTIGRSDLDCVG